MRALTKIVTTLALVGAVAVHADTAAPTVGAGSGSAAPPTKKTVVLTPAEMDAGSKKIKEQLANDARAVMRLKEDVRRAKDVIKLNCINDRDIQIKAQRNLADVQSAGLQDALSKGEPAQPAYETLQGTAEKVRVLREEAHACVGEPELVKKDGVVDVVAPEITDDPTTDNPFVDDPAVSVEPPGYASPFY